jgi:TetR/AcrR family transcriptional regulator, ethionamide resistance regulator
MMRAPRYPRRRGAGPNTGDRGRARLLTALESLLEDNALGQIGVGDITHAAEMTRSAFYYYFPTKASAVAALLSDLEMHSLDATTWLEASEADVLGQLRETLDAAAALWRSRPNLMTAMLDAVHSDPDVAAEWHGWISHLEARVSDRLRRDRPAGGEEIDPGLLAQTLVGVTVNAMERDLRDVRDGREPDAGRVHAVFEVWRRSAYHDAI